MNYQLSGPSAYLITKAFGWALVQTWEFIKKIELKKKVTRKSKIIEILPKLITKILFFFKLAPSFTLAPKKTRALMCKKVLLI